MSDMNLDDLWNRIVVFNDIHFHGWRDQDLRLVSNALAGEVGEVCDATKHLYGGGTNPDLVSKETVDHIGEEVFDSFVYMVLLLGAAGIELNDFVEVGNRKVEVLYQRMQGKTGRL